MFDKVCPYSRGKGLGGTSLINGMVYSRGFPASYDRVAAMGNPGWSYEEVLPYFKKLENFTKNIAGVQVDYEYHGFEGPINMEFCRTNRYIILILRY